MPPPQWLGDDLKYSMPAFLFRRTQYMRFSLNRAEKKMHESAVFFALTNTENGKIVSWYSKKRLAAGKVRVIHSYPISGGYCRTYQAYIKVNGKERHMTNNACKYIGAPSWSFYK
jgi:surface antigen